MFQSLYMIRNIHYNFNGLTFKYDITQKQNEGIFIKQNIIVHHFLIGLYNFLYDFSGSYVPAPGTTFVNLAWYSLNVTGFAYITKLPSPSQK